MILVLSLSVRNIFKEGAYEGQCSLAKAGADYHGVGIEPHVLVETDLALIEQYGNIYLIPDEQDPQILAAIEALNQ